MYLSYLYWPHGRTAVTIIATVENGLPAVFLWNIFLLSSLRPIYIWNFMKYYFITWWTFDEPDDEPSKVCGFHISKIIFWHWYTHFSYFPLLILRSPFLKEERFSGCPTGGTFEGSLNASKWVFSTILRSSLGFLEFFLVIHGTFFGSWTCKEPLGNPFSRWF